MTAFAEQLAAARPAPTVGPAGRAVPLPPSAGSLWEVLSARRSVRSFAERPVAGAELSALLAQALTAQHDRWPGRPPADLAVLLLAYRVTGLTPGWYEVGTDGDFTPVTGAPDLPDPAVSFDGAPAVLVIGGDLGAAVRRADVAGYSDLLVRAAAFAHTCWLTAIGARLGGCLRGRAQGASTAALVAVRPGLRHLLSLTLGHPAPASDPDFAPASDPDPAPASDPDLAPASDPDPAPAPDPDLAPAPDRPASPVPPAAARLDDDAVVAR